MVWCPISLGRGTDDPLLQKIREGSTAVKWLAFALVPAKVTTLLLVEDEPLTNTDLVTS
jgi:hypothetical protein